MEIDMRENYKEKLEMEKVFIHLLQAEINMMVTGKMILLTVKVFSIGKMVQNMMDIGKMVKKKEKEHIL